jgi:diguanylate cyclase (GGDEF)-like protein
MGQGQERRRYARIPMSLEALISISGRAPIACTVKDFCIAGMFIQTDESQLRFINMHDRATLYFGLVVGGERKDLQLNLQVCRVIPTGVGVAFQDPDPKIIDVLQGLATLSPAESASESLADTHKRFAPEFGRILPRLSALVESTAQQMTDEFVRQLADALFVAARDAKTNREATLYIDAQNAVRRRGDAIKKQVPEILAKAAAILGNPLTDRATPSQVTSLSNLSLVDKEEFEEFLSVSEVVSELEGKCKDELRALSRRLGVLARRIMDDSGNPIGPAVVCNAYAESMKGLLTTKATSDIAYKSLRRAIEPHLGRLYEAVNQLLIDNGILPVIEQEKLGFKSLGAGAGRKTDPPVTPVERTANPRLSDTLNPPSAPYQPQPGPYERVAAAAGRAGMMPGAPMAPGMAPAGMGAAPVPGQGMPAGGAPAGYLPPVGGVFPGGVASAAPMMPAAFGGTGYLPVGAAGGMPMMPAGAVTGAAPGYPAMPGGAGGSGGGVGLDATFGGFGYGPSVAVLPSFEQAYLTAQAQLALRRQVAPEFATAATAGGQYFSSTQLANGLTSLQHALLDDAEPEFFDVGYIKQRLSAALVAEGFADHVIGQSDSDAIEVIVSLFQALLQDSMLADFAKEQLKRLQPSVHKGALMDQEFFSSTQHPLRQLLNRVSLLRQEQGPEGQQYSARVRGLIDSVNRDFDGNPDVVLPVVAELDDMLREQRRRYEKNVQQVVSGCNEQQIVLRERREKSGLKPGESTASQQELPPEWNRWLNRSKSLRVGDRLVMNANTRQAAQVTLAWIGDDYNPYVFVDQRGSKSSTLTLQQVAMYLRRGLLKPVQDDGAAAVDRALFGVVNRLHEQVAEQANHDQLTGLLNRKSFLHAIDEKLPLAGKTDAPAVLCQVTLDNLKTINERHGVDAGDAVLKRVAEAMQARYGKKAVTLGRLGGSEIALYWERGGLQVAYKEVQELCATLNLIESLQEGDVMALRCVAGLMAVEDNLAKSEDLLNLVTDACSMARSMPDKPIERDRLALLYQEVRGLSPTAPPTAFVVVSAEDRNGKLVPPTLFSQAAANSDRAYDVDLWALRNILTWMARNEDDVERFSAFIVPLSRAALDSESLANTIIAELMQTAVPPSKVCFEIADKDAVAKLTETADLVNTLREFGCQFILGEFGGARTNYEYLKELAVDYVSIQQDFIDEARQNPKDFAMAKSMNELIHFMGKLTIARQTAEASVADVAKDLGIDFIHDQTRATRLVITADA